MVGNEISRIWKTSPIVFELCEPNQVDLNDAGQMLQLAHASIVHDNDWGFSSDQLKDLMLLVGYRYYLEQASIYQGGNILVIRMKWQNLGYAPNYPKMGQKFIMYFYLLDNQGKPILSVPIHADISTWLPSSIPNGKESIKYEVLQDVHIPINIPKGEYLTGVSIIEQRTGIPIKLAFSGKDENGIYVISKIKIDQ
jgi:hypothetical protein